MEKAIWKIGELAHQTGITVRTLHHYHQIGLLVPSSATEAGHRLYTSADIVCLSRIISLKHLGFGLEEIRAIMEGSDVDPIELINAQLTAIETQMKRQDDLRRQLKIVKDVLEMTGSPDAEEFIKLIGVMNMNNEKLITEEQTERLIAMSEKISIKDKIAAVNDFKKFKSDLDYCYKNKLPASDPKVIAIAAFWRKFTLSAKKNPMYGEIINLRKTGAASFSATELGVDMGIWEYLQNAVGESERQ